VQAWLAGAVAEDDCGAVTMTNNFKDMPDDCGGTVTVTWTATDPCGLTATATATLMVVDTIAR